jgi:capsular polysaccharide biosynthesis protein
MNGEPEGYLPIADVAACREVLPRTVQLPAPPRFQFGTLPAEVAAGYFQAVLLPPAGIYAGTGFDLFDGCILRRDGRLILAPELRLHRQVVAAATANPAREAAYDRRPRKRLPGSAAMIVCPGYADYGLWLTDILPRLATLAESGWELDDLAIPVPHDVPEFGLDLLRLVGVPDKCIVRTDPDDVVKADELLMPTILHNGVRASPMMARFAEMFRTGLRRAGHRLDAPDSPKRIFVIGRERASHLVNRDAIRALAEAAGFVVVHPATLELPQRFALFANATHIVGECGADLANAILSPPGTIVCGLRGSLNQPNFIVSALAEVLDQPSGYVFGQSGTGTAPADFTVAEQAFSDCLRLAFGPHARFEKRARSAAAVMAAKPPPTPAPLRGYRSNPHQAPPPKRPFWKFWQPKPAIRAFAPTVPPGSLYNELLAKPDPEEKT